MNQADKILNQFNQFDSRLLSEIEKIIGANPTRDELFIFVNQGGLDELMSELGIEGLVESFMDEFDEIVLLRRNQFNRALEAAEIERIGNIVEAQKQSNGKSILGHFDANKEKLKQELNRSIISGQSSAETIKNLKRDFIKKSDETPHILTDGNVGTIIGTSYMDMSRTVTREAYSDDPTQLFEYTGTLGRNPSPQCSWLLSNQRKTGYTMAEIDRGIKTPHHNKDGSPKIVNWWGRVPNYNCDEEWLPKQGEH